MYLLIFMFVFPISGYLDLRCGTSGAISSGSIIVETVTRKFGQRIPLCRARYHVLAADVDFASIDSRVQIQNTWTAGQRGEEVTRVARSAVPGGGGGRGTDSGHVMPLS